MSQQINLFNPIFRKQKKYFSSVTMAQALGIIVLACALLAADAARRTGQVRSQLEASTAQLKAKQDRLIQFKAQYAPRQKSATLPAEIVAAQQEFAMLSNASETVKRGGFGDTRGFSEYFRALSRQSREGLWLTEVDIGSGGEKLGVRGNTMQAELVPQYMQRLAGEPVMRGQSFGSLEINRGVAVASPAGSPAAPAPVYLQFSLQSGGPGAKVAVAGQ